MLRIQLPEMPFSLPANSWSSSLPANSWSSSLPTNSWSSSLPAPEAAHSRLLKQLTPSSWSSSLPAPEAAQILGLWPWAGRRHLSPLWPRTPHLYCESNIAHRASLPGLEEGPSEIADGKELPTPESTRTAWEAQMFCACSWSPLGISSHFHGPFFSSLWISFWRNPCLDCGFFFFTPLHPHSLLMRVVLKTEFHAYLFPLTIPNPQYLQGPAPFRKDLESEKLQNRRAQTFFQELVL